LADSGDYLAVCPSERKQKGKLTHEFDLVGSATLAVEKRILGALDVFLIINKYWITGLDAV